jgi:hypothetical protein
MSPQAVSGNLAAVISGQIKIKVLQTPGHGRYFGLVWAGTWKKFQVEIKIHPSAPGRSTRLAEAF